MTMSHIGLDQHGAAIKFTFPGPTLIYILQQSSKSVWRSLPILIKNLSSNVINKCLWMEKINYQPKKHVYRNEKCLLIMPLNIKKGNPKPKSVHRLPL